MLYWCSLRVGSEGSTAQGWGGVECGDQGFAFEVEHDPILAGQLYGLVNLREER